MPVKLRVRARRQGFKTFKNLSLAAVTNIKQSIYPRHLSELNTVLHQIVSGQATYYEMLPTPPKGKARFFATVDGIAVFFDERPPGELLLLHAMKSK